MLKFKRDKSCHWVLIGTHEIGMISKNKYSTWMFEWSGIGRTHSLRDEQRKLGLPLVLESDRLNDLKKEVRNALTDECVKKLVPAIERAIERKKANPPIPLTAEERQIVERLKGAMNSAIRGQ